MAKCQKDATCGIFLNRGLFKDIKNYIPMCRTQKYQNTKIQCAERTNTKIQIQNTQIHKYSIWQGQHMSSSNMINAESPQFTQSSLAPSLSVFIFCPNVKNINWGELLSLKTGCWNTRCNLKKMWGCNSNFLELMVCFQLFHFSLLSEILKYQEKMH